MIADNQIPVPRLDEDEQAWLDRELATHPEVSLAKALRAADIVHELHLAGAVS